MLEDLTQHALHRIRQRGFRESDVDLILDHGTPTRDGVVLSSRDVGQLVAGYRRAIAALERLSGAAVFLADGHVVSVYRPNARKVRAMLRGDRSHRLAPRRSRGLSRGRGGR